MSRRDRILWGRRRVARNKDEYLLHTRHYCPSCGHEDDSHVRVSAKEIARWRGLWLTRSAESEAYHACQAEYFTTKPGPFKNQWGCWKAARLPKVCGQDGCVALIGKDTQPKFERAK